MKKEQERDEQALMLELVNALNHMRDCLANLSLDLKDLEFEMREKENLLGEKFDVKAFLSKY